MNNALKESINCLKYEEIKADDDTEKILDMNMRINIHITQGVQFDTYWIESYSFFW